MFAAASPLTANLAYVFFALAVAVIAAVEAMLIYLAWESNREKTENQWNARFELGWVVVSAIILGLILIASAQTLAARLMP
jgi:heme/copper-type cytochrome/quinol oxidase subunit 2